MPTEKEKTVFAVDIGGTKTAFGCYDSQGRELFFEQFETLPERGAEELVSRVGKSARERLKGYHVLHGVIASPGPLSIERG